MALIEIRWDPSSRELRQFAGIWFPAFFLLVGGLVCYHLGSIPTVVLVIWGTILAVSLIGLVKPSLMRPIFVTWMALAYPIGWTVSHLLLAVVFYGVMTPFGLLMRCLGYDPMERRIDRSAKTYWVAHNPGGDTTRYFRQL